MSLELKRDWPKLSSKLSTTIKTSFSEISAVPLPVGNETEVVWRARWGKACSMAFDGAFFEPKSQNAIAPQSSTHISRASVAE